MYYCMQLFVHLFGNEQYSPNRADDKAISDGNVESLELYNLMSF